MTSVRDSLERELIIAMKQAMIEPMAWGQDDCALWVANILRSALGFDPAVNFRGRYHTPRGARRALSGFGLPGVLREVAREHRWPPVVPRKAEVGDVGLVSPRGRGPSCCVICRGSGWFVGRTEEGFAAVPSEVVRLAWSVGGSL